MILQFGPRDFSVLVWILEGSMAKSDLVEVFPHELRVGDVYRDSGGVEWTVRTRRGPI